MKTWLDWLQSASLAAPLELRTGPDDTPASHNAHAIVRATRGRPKKADKRVAGKEPAGSNAARVTGRQRGADPSDGCAGAGTDSLRCWADYGVVVELQPV